MKKVINLNPEGEKLFKYSPAGILYLSEGFEVLDCNPSFEKETGYGANQVKGKNLTDFLSPDESDAFNNQLNKFGDNIPENFTFKCEMICSDEIRIPFLLTFSTVEDKEGVGKKFLVFMKNLAEDQFFKEELVRLTAKKENLLDVLAHEIKNHLSQVSLSVFYLRKKLNDKIENEDKEFLEYNIINAVNKATKLITELSTGEKHSSVLSLPDTEVFILNDFFTGLYLPYRKWAETKSINFILKQPKKRINVFWDPDRIRKAIDNVFSNALKFSKRKSTIVLSWQEKGDKILISFKDEGIGIPKPLLPELFEKFTPAVREGTEGEKNSGIGLFVTKRVIENHNGIIEVSSKENVGTEVKIILPKNP